MSEQTFQENKPVEPIFDPLNQCASCKIRPGLYESKSTGERVGVYLFNDARGYKICNLCKDKGLLLPKKKMNKSEKRIFKQMRREMGKAIHIKSIPRT